MTRLRTTVLALLATAALAGCGDDGPTDPGPTLSLSIVSGNNQVGAIGAALPALLTVSVEDQSGNAVSGESVTWAVTSAAGPNASVTSSSTTTGTNGQTSVTFTLGDAEGAYEVRASISGSSVTFAAEAGALVIASGNGQVGMAGTQAAQPLVVKAVGTGGVVVPDLEVTFAVTQSEGTGAAVNPLVAMTNASGDASTVLTFGSANGPVRVSASADGSSLELLAYVCGGDASAAVLDLQPGDDAVISGADVSCVLLPAHSAGAEYEVVVTPLPQALGFNDMKLAVTGAPATLPAPALVSPADATTSHSSFALMGGAGLTDWRGRQYAWDMQLRELEKPLRPQIRANAIGGSSFGLMAEPQVGDVTDFGFSCVKQDDFPNTPTDITAEVVKVSSDAVIYEDTLARGAFTSGEYDDIALNFDDVISPTDQLYFGEPSDVPGDLTPGKVIILYTQGVNRMTNNYATDGFIAGFFCPLDLGFDGGNDAKMFYVLVPDPAGDLTPGDDPDVMTKANVLRFTDNTIAHEFQHLINAQVGTGAAEEVWVNEGLSHLAEEVVGHATGQAAGLLNFAPGNELASSDFLQSQASVDVLNKYYIGNIVNLGFYLRAPGDTSALLNSLDPRNSNTFRMRGANWSFLRYLLDRFGAPATEWQMTRQLITDGATTSRQAVTNVFGVPFDALAADWAAMFSVEDRNDLGGAARTSLEMTSYQLRNLYEDFIAPPVLTGSWPLVPATRFLTQPGSVDMDLFTGTSSFVTLRAVSASGGTGLRLMEAGSGADLSAAIAPYMVIVRTK